MPAIRSFAFSALALAATISLSLPASAQSSLSDYLTGANATGQWFGVRDSLEDHGISVTGRWKANFAYVADGGLSPGRGGFQEEFVFRLNLDFEKMFGLTGLSAQGNLRWRDGEDPNAYVGASTLFRPSQLQGGKQWRLQPVFLKWESQDLLWTEDALLVRGGWLSPSDVFIDQPNSKVFVNNTLTSHRGLTPNRIPWGGSFVGWGGDLRVKPVDWHYVQAGLYLAYPDSTSTANHGLAFEGATRDRNLNGLYFVGETGVTPKFGPDELPGRYAFGGIYWGLENTTFDGERTDGNFVLYWQADQMLFREPSAPKSTEASDGKAFAGKSFKSPVELGNQPLSDQGLSFFSLVNYAPSNDNALPFYFHIGLVYKGLIPGRDDDQLGVAFAFGEFSYDQILARRDAGQTLQRTTEGVFEADYRIALTRFAYVQPYLQYIIRPGAQGLIENVTVLGSQFGLTF